MRRSRGEQPDVGRCLGKRSFKKLKSCFLKTGEKILELLEEVRDFVRRKLSSVPHLPHSLGASLQWSLEHPAAQVGCAILGGDGEWAWFSCTSA